MNSFLLLSAIGGISDDWIMEAENSRHPAPSRRLFEKRLLLISAAMIAALRFQEPSVLPVEVVRGALEKQINKEYAKAVRIVDISVDEVATERAKKNYAGSELAEKNGWTDSYLKNNMIVVRAVYYAEYDHEKTFLTDGEITQYFILLKRKSTGKWRIWSNTTANAPFLGMAG